MTKVPIVVTRKELTFLAFTFLFLPDVDARNELR